MATLNVASPELASFNQRNEKPASALRPPWPVTASTLLALLTMALTRRDGFLAIALGLALGATYLTDVRLAAGSLRAWLLRVAAFAAVAIVTLSNPPATNTPIAITAQMIDVVMQLCMAELVVQYWQRPLLGGSGAVLILLSAFVFVAASKTFERVYLPVMTPIYISLLVYALHSVRARAVGSYARAASRWMRPLLIVLTLSVGYLAADLIYRYKKKIDRTGFAFATALQTADKVVGFASSPVLGEVQNAERAMTRVLRMEGLCEYPHLRGMAFYDYMKGRWDPPAENRGYEAISSGELNLHPHGSRVTFTRLIEEPQLLFLPLHTAGVYTSEVKSIERDTRGGSALIMRAQPPATYSALLNEGAPRHQGPLCIPMDEEQLERCLDIPDSISAGVMQIARKIAGGEKDPLKRLLAVETYLQTNYQYSLTTDPGDGDPVSNFLINKNAAHCEYFASGAVMLLRCMKIPARYVSGFYAHETSGAQEKIVRAQDAHAWAEAWIDGTGWVTVDGTPPAGRPDVLFEAPTFWRRAAEWLTDAFYAARSAILKLNPQQFAGLAAAALVVATALTYRQRRAARRKITLPAARGDYSVPGDALAALAAHFDALLQRRNVPCPQNLTWLEHLELVAITGGRAIDLEKARQFLNQYNAVRFGCPENAEAAARLRALLDELEE